MELGRVDKIDTGLPKNFRKLFWNKIGSYGGDYASDNYLPAQYYKAAGVMYPEPEIVGVGSPINYWLMAHSFLTTLDFLPSYFIYLILQLCLLLLEDMNILTHINTMYFTIIWHFF